MNAEPLNRAGTIQKVQEWLQTCYSPRLHMFFIVLTTGTCGFLFSYGLLHAGLHRMWIRYPLSLGLAYLVFLGLLRLWLGCFGQTSTTTNSESMADVLDVVCDWSTTLNGHTWGIQSTADAAGDLAPALDLDETLVVVLVVSVVCLGLATCVYVVWTAPGLLAEILVDSAIMVRVYRKLQKAEGSSWLFGAFRRTWIPTTVMALFLTGAGYALQQVAPQASSIGPALHQFFH